jgi:transaldolase
MLYALQLGSDIITAPFKVLKEWGEKGLPVPGSDYTYNAGELNEIPYVDLDLNKSWQDFDISHELTDKGVASFSTDWNNLIK